MSVHKTPVCVCECVPLPVHMLHVRVDVCECDCVSVQEGWGCENMCLGQSVMCLGQCECACMNVCIRAM